MSPSARDLLIVDLTSPDQLPGLLRAAYEAVLRPSFTREELDGPDDVAPGDGRIVTIVTGADEEPLGVAVTEARPGDVSLLAYLAVSPAARGRGVGSALLRHLTGLWEESGCALVLAEVHDPRGHADGPGEHPEARLRFYERGGARVLNVPFVQPALAPGLARVPDMLLLAMHPRGIAAVSGAEISRWVEDYYEGAEGSAPGGPDDPGDPQLRALLARLRARPEIAVWELGRWREVEPLTWTSGD